MQKARASGVVSTCKISKNMYCVLYKIWLYTYCIMLIVQPCSDNVHLVSSQDDVLIARDRVEYDLSSAFLRLSEGQDVLFVSGPGSFTNLRVA